MQEGPRGEQGHVTELVLQIETVQDNLILNHLLRPDLVGVGLVVQVSLLEKYMGLNLSVNVLSMFFFCSTLLPLNNYYLLIWTTS